MMPGKTERHIHDKAVIESKQFASANSCHDAFWYRLSYESDEVQEDEHSKKMDQNSTAELLHR